jgi:hypothetical protein
MGLFCGVYLVFEYICNRSQISLTLENSKVFLIPFLLILRTVY